MFEDPDTSPLPWVALIATVFAAVAGVAHAIGA
jgi:hypothetical protein